MLSINTNLLSLDTQNALSQSQQPLATAMERLSTGLRINSAADDAAGLAISTRMGAQVNGLNQAVANANDAISLLQTAGGTLSTITNNLQTIRTLAVQAGNSTNSPSDESAMNTEVQQLLSEINRAAQTAQFNGINLLDGSFANQSFQVGAFAGQTISISSIASALTSGSNSTSLTYTGAVTASALVSSALQINGVAIGSSVAGNGILNSTGIAMDQSADSAWAIANAINAANPGVTATANAVTVSAGSLASVGDINAGAITINGVSIGSVTSGTDSFTEAQNIAAAMNSLTPKTGVTATVLQSGGAGSIGYITLTDSEGGDIVIAGAGAGSNAGLTAGTTTGTVGLSSPSGDIVIGSSLSPSGVANGAAQAGFTSGTYYNPGGTTGTGTGLGIAGLNVNTVAGAQAALIAVDAALTTINTSQANLGAYQNRFSSVVSTLQNASQNLSSAKSTITDADYAAETADMTKAMITQQAGISVLAQANTIPQQILALLPK